MPLCCLLDSRNLGLPEGQLVYLTGARSLLSLWILADHFAHRAAGQNSLRMLRHDKMRALRWSEDLGLGVPELSSKSWCFKASVFTDRANVAVAAFIMMRCLAAGHCPTRFMKRM